MLRLLVLLASLLLAQFALAAQDAAPAAPARIVAVGDLHGDYEAWEEIARAAGIVDTKGVWSGGGTTLVQMGDITDRGPDSLRIIRQLQRLAGEAPADGGQVIVLLGNHEAMNVTGDLRYVHPGEYEAFRTRSSRAVRLDVWATQRDRLAELYRTDKPDLPIDEIKRRWLAETPLGMIEHRRSWRAGGELGLWAASLPAVVQLGPTLFTHGGLSAERSAEDIATINSRHQAAFAPGDEVDRSVLDDPLGPLWYRGNVVREPDDTEPQSARLSREEELATVLARYGAQRLVIAHTPSPHGIADDLGGKLLRIDTGISRHYGGPASYLEIEGDRITAHQRESDGSWTSRIVSKGAPR
ncbi:metallophosphoesterase [Qipengyuania gaetbuli]|uniref:metallophosphoesterase n=1 Tax=Qipengyuania gaetbuli TaxID=266952 RepID=UPI001C9931AF|nr:metallophosphoesterase [Qipengyuania gaetbuli]MBY6015542.1 metallophosphoesterase [Qipengyuania gaetbuli]